MSWSLWNYSTRWLLYDWNKMKKIIILIPIFNDWESLQKLIIEIDKNINGLNNILFECFIINDASSINQPKLKKPEKINKLKVLNMKKNRGHARCNAFGIRYIFQKENFDYLIPMDGDGEDRPGEIKNFLKKLVIIQMYRSLQKE